MTGILNASSSGRTRREHWDTLRFETASVADLSPVVSSIKSLATLTRHTDSDTAGCNYALRMNTCLPPCP